jgi:hypothetical protein
MVVQLKRFILDSNDNGHFINYEVKLSSVDAWSMDDGELCLVINGVDFYFEVDNTTLKSIKNYFNLLKCSNN